MIRDRTTEQSKPRRGLRGFFDNATVTKAFMLVLVYMVIYLLVGRLITFINGPGVNVRTVFDSATNVFIGLVIPIGLGAILILTFGKVMGWTREVFGKQPVPGRKWMYIAPLLVLAAIVLRFAGASYESFDTATILMIALAGLCVGIAEEVLTRGYVVKILRDAGKPEVMVAILSSLIFAAMHASNILAGQQVITVLSTLAFTFGFGICMYLTMRATGTILSTIILHALYDMSLFLATGGIDEVTKSQAGGALAAAASLTVAFLVFAVLSLFFIRGTAARRPQPARVQAVHLGEASDRSENNQ